MRSSGVALAALVALFIACQLPHSSVAYLRYNVVLANEKSSGADAISARAGACSVFYDQRTNITAFQVNIDLQVNDTGTLTIQQQGFTRRLEYDIMTTANTTTNLLYGQFTGNPVGAWFSINASFPGKVGQDTYSGIVGSTPFQNQSVFDSDGDIQFTTFQGLNGELLAVQSQLSGNGTHIFMRVSFLDSGLPFSATNQQVRISFAPQFVRPRWVSGGSTVGMGAAYPAQMVLNIVPSYKVRQTFWSAVPISAVCAYYGNRLNARLWYNLGSVQRSVPDIWASAWLASGWSTTNLSPRGSASPTSAAGMVSIGSVMTSTQGVSFRISVTAVNVPNTTSCDMVDYQGKSQESLSYSMSVPASTGRSWWVPVLRHYNSTLFAQGRFMYKVQLICYTGSDYTSTANRLLTGWTNPNAQLPTPSNWDLIAFLQSPQTSLPKPGAFVVGATDVSTGTYVLSVQYPRTAMSQALANNSSVRILSNQPPAGLVTLATLPLGVSFPAGTASTTALQNVYSLQLSLVRGAATLASGQISQPPLAVNAPQVATTAPPTTASGVPNLFVFRSIMDADSVGGVTGSGGMARFEWVDNIAGHFHLYYSLNVFISSSTTLRIMTIYVRTSQGDIPMAFAPLYNNLGSDGLGKGYVELGRDASLLPSLQAGNAYVVFTDSSNRRILGGGIWQDKQEASLQAAYYDTVVAVMVSSTSRYACVSRAGYNNPMDRAPVVIHCSANATFRSALVYQRLANGTDVPIGTVLPADKIMAGGWGKQMVYTQALRDVAFTSPVLVRVQLTAATLLGAYNIVPQQYHADLSGMAIGNARAASFGYAMLDWGLGNQVSVTIFLSGLRTELTRAVLTTPSGLTMDLTNKFDDGVCLTSFRMPYYKFKDEIAAGWTGIRISTAAFASGAIGGNFTKRPAAMSIFNGNPVELTAVLSGQQASPVNPVALGVGGSVSFFIMPPAQFPAIGQAYYDVLGSVSFSSIGQLSPPDLLQAVTVTGTDGNGLSTQILSFGLVSGNSGMQVFNLSTTQIGQLMFSTIKASTFRYSPVAAGLVLARPRVQFVATSAGQAPGSNSMGAGFATSLLDRFGMYHYTVQLAGFTNQYSLIGVYEMPSQQLAADITSDFTGYYGYNEIRPSISFFLGLLNSAYYLNVQTVTPSGIRNAGTLIPSIRAGFADAHLTSVMSPTSPVGTFGAVNAYLSATGSWMSIIFSQDSNTRPAAFVLADASGNEYAGWTDPSRQAFNSLTDEAIVSLASLSTSALDMLATGQLWVNGLDAANISVLSGQVQIKRQAFESLLSPTVSGSGGGFLELQLNPDGSLGYKVYITGLVGLSAVPTVRLDAGQSGTQLFSQLPGIRLAERRFGTYWASGKIDLSEYAATTSQWQFYQLYTSARCSVYTSTGLVLSGPVETVSFGDTGESVDLSAVLTGSQIAPTPVSGRGAGSGVFEFQENGYLHFHIIVRSVSSDITSAYIAGPAPRGWNGPVIFNLMPYLNSFTFHGFVKSANKSLVTDLLAGNLYVQVATVNNPNGEVRAQIKPNTQVYSDVLRPATTFNNGGIARFEVDHFGSVYTKIVLDVGTSLSVVNSNISSIILYNKTPGDPSRNVVLDISSFISHRSVITGSFPATPKILYALTHRRMAVVLAGCAGCPPILTGTPTTFGPIFVKSGPPVVYFSLMTGSALISRGLTKSTGSLVAVLDTKNTLYYYMQLNGIASRVTTITIRNSTDVIQFSLTISATLIGSGWTDGSVGPLTAWQMNQLATGSWYLLVTTVSRPFGDIQGTIVLDAQVQSAVLLPGTNNPTGGAALSRFLIDYTGNVRVKYAIHGLSGPLTQANFADQQTTTVGASLLNRIVNAHSATAMYQQSASWYPLLARGQLQLRLGTQARVGGELNGFFRRDITSQDIEYRALLCGFAVGTIDGSRKVAKTSAGGQGAFFFDGQDLRYYITVGGLSGTPTSFSLFVGAGAGYVSKWNASYNFMPAFDGDTATGVIRNPSKDMQGFVSNGSAYILITTANFPLGELRGNLVLEIREAAVLLTQSGNPLVAKNPPTGFSVGMLCYTATGLYCTVYKSNDSAVITSMTITDEESNILADIFPIYSFLGNWFYYVLPMNQLTMAYAGRLYITVGTPMYPAGEVSGKVSIDREFFTDYYNSRYQALIGSKTSRASGYIVMNHAYGLYYDYRGYVDGAVLSSCTLSNPVTARPRTNINLAVNGYEFRGRVILPVSTFATAITLQCRTGSGDLLSGPVVLEVENFLAILTGQGVTSAPQTTATAGIVAVETTASRSMTYTGRTWGLSPSSFGSMQIVFSDGPQFFTANSTGSDSFINLPRASHINELYATNTTIDVRPPSGTGLAPTLLAGRVLPAGPPVDLLNYLRGKPATRGQLNLPLTPSGVPSSLTLDKQGQGGLLQLFYARSSYTMSVLGVISGLTDGLQRVGFWSTASGLQIIDLLPIIGSSVFAGTVQLNFRIILTRQQLDLFKENQVYFRADSSAYNKQLGKIGSVVYNRMVTLPQNPWYAVGSVKEEQPNAYVMDIPDTFIFPAPNTLTYQFISGQLLGGSSVFVALPNGTLYTGINSTYVPDFEQMQVMVVVMNLLVNGTFFAQVNLVATIIDINDNYPMFVSAPNNTRVSEDTTTTPRNDVLSTILVSDRDSPKYGNPVVTIVRATNALGQDYTSSFRVNQPSPGGPAQILRAKPLDYDMPGNQWFKIDLLATDGTPANGWDRKTANTSLYISLIDLNDNRPIFAQMSYNSLPEETLAIGSVILRVTATDADSTTNAQLTYSIRATDGSPAGQFSVSTVKQGSMYVAQVAVARQLDFETRNLYNLSLTATDGGLPRLSSAVPVYIMVVNQPFRLVITYPPPFVTVFSNNSNTGNFANNNRARFTFSTNLEDGITTVGFQCRVVTHRAACRYARTGVGACSATCGEGIRTVTLQRVSVAFPADSSCVSKTIVETCQDRTCPDLNAPPVSRRRRQTTTAVIPCGKDLYCEQLDVSDLTANPFKSCTDGGLAISRTGTFTQSDPADGDYTFQLRANVSIQQQSRSFVGYTNATLTYTIDTTAPTTTIRKDLLPRRNNRTCPVITFTNDDTVTYYCKLEFAGETRNFTACSPPFNPCTQPASYGYGPLWRNGLYTFSVYSVDRALNRETFAKTYTYELDTFRPLVGLVMFPPRINSLSSLNFEYVSNDTDARVTCWLNKIAVNCPVNGFSLTGTEGENHFTMVAVDPAGNFAPFVDYLFFIDLTVPNVHMADITENVFTTRSKAYVHLQSSEELSDLRCRTQTYPNATAYTELLSQCCNEAYSSAISKEENCLTTCMDFSGDSKAALTRVVCRLYLRRYSECLENKTKAFSNAGVSGTNRLRCEADSSYPTLPSCRNGTYYLGSRTAQAGFYIFQAKYRDLNKNAQCYQSAFVYEPRYVSSEQDANDVGVELQTCPADSLPYTIFMACSAGLLVIALVVCLSYYCYVQRSDPYSKPLHVGPATAVFSAANEDMTLNLGEQQMFDDSRYAGAHTRDDKVGLTDAMEMDPGEEQYEALDNF